VEEGEGERDGRMRARLGRGIESAQRFRLLKTS
jgi:hypothetical protein